MGAGITALIGLISQAFTVVTKWWADRKQKQEEQNAAVKEREKYHTRDGAESVANKNSADEQNRTLDELAKQLDSQQ